MNFKRGLSFLLAVVMLCVMLPFGVSAKEITATVNTYNSSRGTGELAVFTSEYGNTTGTNYWGAEAIVGADNIVTEIAMGNSEIPVGGFVVSGHDDDSTADGPRMKMWIYENIQAGDYVYFDRRSMQITVSDTPLEIETSPFYEISKEASGVNTSRDENTLIVYTPLAGTSTGTNTYGYEVAVDSDGLIVSIGGNDSAIPVGGFVVSGHGTMSDWLRNAVIHGMRAEFDKDTQTVRFHYDADSVKLAVEAAINDTKTAIDDAKAAFVYADYESIDAAFAKITPEYETRVAGYESGELNDTAFADTCDAVLSELNAIRNSLCDSYTVQYRAVWVRPSQKNAAEVDTFVKSLHDAGINTVAVEGWFENGVIMEVPEDSLFGKHASFSYDVLQAYIDACHKYDMECHLWMPIMNIGSSVDGHYDRSVLSKKPEWLSLSNEGTPDNPDGFMMIDPANEEAREYLVSFYEYLVTSYDIDCFELDYIRYYSAGELDFGYTEAAFAGFEEAYGYGVTPTYDTEADYWEDWKQYRRDCVTEMVKAVKEMMDIAAPDMLLSADVAATAEEARNRNYQDYPRWLEAGLIDILHPMAYGDGYGEEITNAVELGGDHTVVVTGLGAQTSLGAEDMERQAREDNSYGCYGDAYFEAHSYLSDKAGDALLKTVYRNDALAPFLDRDASITEALRYMQGRIDDILLPLGGLTDSEASALTDAIIAVKATVADAHMDSAALEALTAAIDAVENAAARKVLKSDLYRARRITYISDGTVTDETDTDTSDTTQPDITVVVAVIVAFILLTAAVIVLVIVLQKRRTPKA